MSTDIPAQLPDDVIDISCEVVMRITVTGRLHSVTINMPKPVPDEVLLIALEQAAGAMRKKIRPPV
jgi:hypothetical protein